MVDEFDVVDVAVKVSRVEGEEAAFAVGEHGGDDIGVVDLASADGDIAAEGEQGVCDRRAVFKDFEVLDEAVGVVEDIFGGERNRPGLRSSEDREVFADDLAADAERLTVIDGLLKAGPRETVIGRLADAGVDEDVGVDEHWVD